MTGTDGADRVLDWGVRRGWRAYVLGLSDGRFVTDDGVELEPASAQFPLADESGWDDGRGILKFRGRLTAHGHFGMLLGHVVDPWLEIDDDGARLTVVRWPGRDERIPIATLDGDPLAGPVGATLTLEGTEVFGNVYRAGSPMDPVAVIGVGPTR